MITRKFAAGLLGAALALPWPMRADEDGAAQVQALLQASQRAKQAYETQIEAAKSADARASLDAKDPDAAFARQFLELGKKLGADPAAAESLIYAVQGDSDGSTGREAMELLGRDHVNSPQLEMLLNSYPHPRGPAAENLFRAIEEQSTNRVLRAQSMLILAESFKDYRPDEAEQVLRELIEKYGDVDTPAGPALDLARKDLVFVQKLSVGRAAPEISAGDLDGKGFKLSELRGQVVLIVFCGEWCAPCRALYPYERSLAQRMQDKPFALISLSSDPKETALKAKQRERLTWRILWDGGSTHGPITSEWQIQGWPNLYLIDSRGFIREHWTGSPGTQVMDQAMHKLVKEAEGAKPDGR